MKGENPITSYCVVLTFKSQKYTMASQGNISFLKHWIHTFLSMMTACIKLLILMMDGCLILNKLVRRRVKLYQ